MVYKFIQHYGAGVLNKHAASLLIFEKFSYLHALIRYLHVTVGTDHAKNRIASFTYSECDHVTKEPRLDSIMAEIA